MKKIVLEISIAVAVIVGISMYQGRNLLSTTSGAPALEGFTQDGLPVSLSFQQPTMLYFFAPWCTVCKLNMGNLDWLRKLSGINIVIVGLDYEKPEQVFDLLQEKGLKDFQVILGNEKTSDFFQIEAYPTYYTIDRNGKVKSSSVGYSPLAGLLFRSWLATL